MKIESIDFFYLSNPVITDDVDGSQDALLVRARSENFEGWGECEGAPLPCIAAYFCPSSHGVCQPVMNAVRNAPLNEPADIRRINHVARRICQDLLQAEHTLSGVDVALWDLLGRARNEPVYSLLGNEKVYPKRPYASVLMGENAAATFSSARRIREQGYTAAKFGWGPFGLGALKADEDQIVAAREGLGDDADLLLDAGSVWVEDPTRPLSLLETLHRCRATWLEEPFHTQALQTYYNLSQASPRVALAAGEGVHNIEMARNLAVHGGVSYLQIDAGRIGGISTAADACKLALETGVQYVNHTFTSHLALSASLQPFAAVSQFDLAEYPTELQPVAASLASGVINRDANGLIHAPDSPGLGVVPNLEKLRAYQIPVRIALGDHILYESPEL